MGCVRCMRCAVRSVRCPVLCAVQWAVGDVRRCAAVRARMCFVMRFLFCWRPAGVSCRVVQQSPACALRKGGTGALRWSMSSASRCSLPVRPPYSLLIATLFARPSSAAAARTRLARGGGGAAHGRAEVRAGVAVALLPVLEGPAVEREGQHAAQERKGRAGTHLTKAELGLAQGRFLRTRSKAES